jgi:chromate transport protein ChrA
MNELKYWILYLNLEKDHEISAIIKTFCLIAFVLMTIQAVALSRMVYVRFGDLDLAQAVFGRLEAVASGMIILAIYFWKR